MSVACFLPGGAAAIIAIIGAVCCLVGVTSNNWVVVEHQNISSSHRTGLVQSCRGSSCETTQYGELTHCGKSPDDLELRFQAVAGGLILGTIGALASAALALMAVLWVKRAANSLGGGEFPSPYHSVSRRVLLDELIGRRVTAVPIVAAVSLFFLLAGQILWQFTFSEYVECGRDMCAPFPSSAGYSCGFGYGHYVLIAGTCIIGLQFIVSLIWAVYYYRLQAKAEEYVEAGALVSRPSTRAVSMRQSHRTSRAVTPSSRSASRQRHPPYGHGVDEEQSHHRHDVDDGSSRKSDDALNRIIRVPRKQTTLPNCQPEQEGTQRSHPPTPSSNQRTTNTYPPTARPMGDDWEEVVATEDEYGGEEPFLFSATHQLYFHRASLRFYDPDTELWFNEELDAWESL